jgi:transcriptional regulator with XRE-family HTH domain
VPFIALRQGNFRNLLDHSDFQSNAAFARRAGITPGQLWRIMAGQSGPGISFIAGTLDIFGIDVFADLFEIVS